jgi:hypothetical protein
MTDKTLNRTIRELIFTGFYLLVTLGVIATNITSLFGGPVTQSDVSQVIGFNLSYIFVLSIALGFLIVRNILRTVIAKY